MTVEMSREILDFLTKLAVEPQTLSDYLQDPKVTMERENIEAKAQVALMSGDPLRVHVAIMGNAAAHEEALEKSRQNAETVMDILSSDPVVAQWFLNYYSQLLMWNTVAGIPSSAAGVDAASCQAAPQQPVSSPSSKKEQGSVSKIRKNTNP